MPSVDRQRRVAMEDLRRVINRMEVPSNSQRLQSARVAAAMIGRWGFIDTEVTEGMVSADRDRLMRNLTAMRTLVDSEGRVPQTPATPDRPRRTRQQRNNAQSSENSLPVTPPEGYRVLTVQGYTRADGRVVREHTRIVKVSAASTRRTSGPCLENPDGETREGYSWVNGYARANGVQVKGYWRKIKVATVA